MLLMVLDTGAAVAVGAVDSSIRHSIQLDLEVTSGACSPLNSACIPLWGDAAYAKGGVGKMLCDCFVVMEIKLSVGIK